MSLSISSNFTMNVCILFLSCFHLSFGCHKWVMEEPKRFHYSGGGYNKADINVYEKYYPLVVGLNSLLSPPPFDGLTKMLIDSLKAAFSTGSMAGAPSVDDIVRAVRPVIKDELTRQTIDENSPKLQGAIDWYEHTYLNLVGDYNLSSTVDREKLWDTTMIKNVALTASTLANLFSSDRYKTLGLGFFQAAAALHLNILQQQCLIDPIHLNPENSSYKKIWREYGKKYAKRGREIVLGLINDKITNLFMKVPDFRRHGSGYKYANGWTIGQPQKYYLHDGTSWMKETVSCPSDLDWHSWCYYDFVKNICRPKAKEFFNEFVTGFKKHWELYNTWDSEDMTLGWTSNLEYEPPSQWDTSTFWKKGFTGLNKGADCGRAEFRKMKKLWEMDWEDIPDGEDMIGWEDVY